MFFKLMYYQYLDPRNNGNPIQKQKNLEKKNIFSAYFMQFKNDITCGLIVNVFVTRYALLVINTSTIIRSIKHIQQDLQKRFAQKIYFFKCFNFFKLNWCT